MVETARETYLNDFGLDSVANGYGYVRGTHLSLNGNTPVRGDDDEIK